MFVNLEAESAFSLLHGTFRPAALVKAAKDRGHRAVGLTDRWGIYGMAEFLAAARAQGMEPLIGARVMLEDGSWLSLYPLSRRGFRNLNRLISIGLKRGRRRGRIRCVTRRELEENSGGLAAIAGGFPSRLRQLARRRERLGAERELRGLASYFKDRLYIALSWNCPEDTEANSLLYRLAEKTGAKAVISNPVVYLTRQDAWLHRLLVNVQIRYHKQQAEPLPGDGFVPMTLSEALERIPFQDAARQTVLLAERLKGFRPEIGPRAMKANLAAYEERGDGIRHLWRKALTRLARSRMPCPAAYISRLYKELEIIEEKGLSRIFLLMGRVKEFADAAGIISSIRGSSGGSLLVHLLLGGPDPIRHGLLFERFINRGRSDIPDIDMDFDSERRDEVTRWLLDTEADSSALVATIHTFRPRSAVRLSARAMGYPLHEIDRLTRCLPWSLRGISLTEALERLPELKGSPLRQETELVQAAERIEGLPFQTSVHLGGVVVAPDDILYWSPVSGSSKGFRVCQLDKDAVDALGLLKLDLLGLRMHTAMKKALSYVESIHGCRLPDRIDSRDEKTYSMLCSGDTLGVFQLESPGQRNLVARLLPRRFQDITVEISLFRPGPVKSDMVERYLRRRHGLEETDCLHPCLEEILRDTCGVIVFQEQVLEIVHRFAGFSYDDADAFRRAMTKNRSRREMEGLKSAFMQGARRLGHPGPLAEEVFQKVAAFAAYGFCKAHAVAFAEITLKSAYLKAHYPREFYLGLLNAGHVGSYPPWVILNEARRRQIPIYPPDVNMSLHEYAPEGTGIRLPLTVIKGIGPRISWKVVQERKRGGPFSGLNELAARTGLDAGRLRILWKAGAAGAGKEAA